MLIAIHPDKTIDHRDRSAPRWAESLEKAGHQVRWVDVFRPDILDQLRGCDGFMWRHAHVPRDRAVARRLLPVLERELGLCVYPDQNTCWHYDDKIAQFYLFGAAGIPMPRTWVFWRKEDAIEFCQRSSYPLVLKLWAGAGSSNVRMVQGPKEARAWIDVFFASGLFSLRPRGRVGLREVKRRAVASAKVLLTGRLPDPGSWHELHKNYILLQELVPDNLFDTRITIIGNRAFGYRRFNRPNDFRASGSGNFDANPDAVDLEAVRLGFDVAKRLRAQSAAIDCLRKGDRIVITEISYTYVNWMIADCPGHWELTGDPASGELAWWEGHMWPEDAHVEDLLRRLERNQVTKAAHQLRASDHANRGQSS